MQGANLIVRTVGGFSLTTGQTFFVLDRTSSDLTATGAFANAPGGVYTDLAGERFLVNYAARNPADGDLNFNDVSLTVLAVPEPGAWTLLAGGGAVLLAVQRRRRRQI